MEVLLDHGARLTLTMALIAGMTSWRVVCSVFSYNKHTWGKLRNMIIHVSSSPFTGYLTECVDTWLHAPLECVGDVVACSWTAPEGRCTMMYGVCDVSLYLSLIHISEPTRPY